MTLPTIHTNGTSAKDLMDGYEKSDDALRQLEEAFGGIEFNARDYYIKGPVAFEDALSERHEIWEKINAIKQYIDAHRVAIWEQTHK